MELAFWVLSPVRVQAEYRLAFAVSGIIVMSPSSVLMSLSYGGVMCSGKGEVQWVETRLFMRENHAGFY